MKICTEISINHYQSRKIAERYVRFCIRGKLGRTVPVLLSQDLFECINLILKFREEAKVPTKNPYIFGLPSNDKRRYILEPVS